MFKGLDNVISRFRGHISSKRDTRKFFKYFSYGGSTKLYVIAPYWTAKISQIPMKVLKDRILKAGCSCLTYQFPKRILSDNVDSTEKYFKEIEVEVKDDISELQKKYNFTEIIVIGISLGCVSALMISNGNLYVNKILLVVPGDSLSESLWHGVGTVTLKKKLLKRGVTLGDLKECWKDLDPVNNLDFLSGKKIEIHLSKSDKVIPYRNGSRLVKKMQDAGLNPTIFNNEKLGHYLTFLNFIRTKMF